MINLSEYPNPHTVRTFDIEVISLPIVYNKYGDYDPNGLLYVLKKDSQKIQEIAKEKFMLYPPQPYKEVQPLVIRANVGDKLHVNLYNKLNRKVSLHVQGLKYDVLTSDGANVGLNPDSTANIKASYTWYAEHEGVYLFSDMADTRSSEDGTNVHGLFGAVIIEEAGSSWFDPVTGEASESGLFADIYNPVLPAFREYAVFFHDELEIKNKDGLPPIDPHTNLPAATTGISYRAEPMRNRMPLQHEPGETGEDISMSSWPYGDPAPSILRAYVGDPSKIRLINGGIKETHVFHLHNHQWKLEPKDPKSTIIDSISVSPQECYTLDILYGAGSLNGMIGDAIWHCHLYPHFHEGMWSLWRVFDRLQDGTGEYPDKTPIEALMPLKDRKKPPLKDSLHPGYPNFINGEYGEEPNQPPLGVYTAEGENIIDPTPLEQENFVPGYVPGALYTNTCPCDTDENVKTFRLALVQAKIIYNRYGWHDPQGRFFVLMDEIERYCSLEEFISKIECGDIQPEPLVIRANAGDCIEIQLTNLLPSFIEGNEFQLRTITDIAGFHIHLVKFDTIIADGGSNGWNNISGARQGETIIERFYANEELHTVFFHDHLYANTHQQHGVFGALIIEPAGSIYLDPKSGRELKSGTQAVIRKGNGEYYREFALFVHDFALLFDKDGSPINPPAHPGSDDDPGVMGINYRAEPLGYRLCEGEDPAYVFSSVVHNDPATPLLETYPGEPLMIRLINGAHEEQHAFNINGMSWKKEITDTVSPVVQEQTIGLSEAFNININEYYKPGDYLYYFGGIDDIWLGLWGIIRVYAKKRKYLFPLCKGHKFSKRKSLRPPKDAIIRKFEIAAIQSDIKYNRYGDHDPEGLLFVPLEDARAVMSGLKKPIPLILRANAGEWIEVTLHNMFDPEKPILYNDYPSVPVDMHHTPSKRVSLNPQFIKFDPILNSGINVGYNPIDQTVKPGKKMKYIWYADKEYGSCLLTSFGDLRNHRHHGLFGAIIIEPPAAIYYKGSSPAKNNYEEQAVITAPGVENFREFVLFIQNGIYLLDKNGEIIKTSNEVEVIKAPDKNFSANSKTEIHEVRVETKAEETNEEKTEEITKKYETPYKDAFDDEIKADELEAFDDENSKAAAEVETEIEEYDAVHDEINVVEAETGVETEEHEAAENEILDAFDEAEIKADTVEHETPKNNNTAAEPIDETEIPDHKAPTDENEDGGHGAPDHEDTGEKGYNYRSERFFNRLQKVSKIERVFDSKLHGDPATPVLKAFAGERVIIRLLMPADKPRNTGFLIHGHQWKAQPSDPFSRVVSMQGAISVGSVYNIELEGGASSYPGDYLYRSGSLKWDIESGMWGILRILPRLPEIFPVDRYNSIFGWKNKDIWKNPGKNSGGKSMK